MNDLTLLLSQKCKYTSVAMYQQNFYQETGIKNKRLGGILEGEVILFRRTSERKLEGAVISGGGGGCIRGFTVFELFNMVAMT